MKNSLKKNIVYNFVYQVLILFLPFITAPYLARTIGAEGVGTFSFSQSVALYFSYLILLGLNNYGNRSIATVQTDEKKRSIMFFEIYSMQLIMSVISICLYIAYVALFSVDKFASVLMVMWVISSLLDINWFFFGMEQFRITVIRNAIIKVFTVVCIFTLVHNQDDVYIYIGIMSFSTLLSQCCLWPYMKRFVHFERPTWEGIHQHFKPNFKLFIPVLAASIYNMMDKIMLGYMTNMREVGYYENAVKIIQMIQSLIVAVGTVMLPRMTALFSSNENTESNRYFDISIEIVLIYVSAAIFGILSVKNEFTNLYFGQGFGRTSLILGVLIFTVFFFGVSNVLRTQYLIPKKMDKIFINSAILGAILNFLVNIILIPKYSSIGAAIATILAEATVCFYQFFMVRKTINIQKYMISALKYLLAGFFMFVILQIIPTSSNELTNFIVKVVVGVLIFTLLTGLVLFFKIRERKKTKNDL